MIDSGVIPNLDIESHLLPGADFSTGAETSTGDGHADTDADGHGTGMATIIAGSGNSSSGGGVQGLAPESMILPIRASTTNGEGLAFALAPAMTYASSHHVGVINLSVGEPSQDLALQRSINGALSQDIVVVAGVGNDGSATRYYPAAYPGVLGVGAIDSNGNVWPKSNTGPDVGLVAPGVNIYRDDNRGRQGYSDGTSEATAYVSAAAALVRSAHPTWTAPQVVAALIATADKPAAMHGAVRTDQYGYGILDVLAALRLTAPPPVGVTGSPDPVNSNGVAKPRAHGGEALAPWGFGVALAGVLGSAGYVLARRRTLRRRRG